MKLLKQWRIVVARKKTRNEMTPERESTAKKKAREKMVETDLAATVGR